MSQHPGKPSDDEQDAAAEAFYGDDDDNDFREPWCKDLEGHKAAHRFCDDHQAMWCRLCDRGCPDCAEDPHCPDCHCALFSEEHDWDCAYAGDDDEL